MTIQDFDVVVDLWKSCEGIGLSDADSRAGIVRFLERNPESSFVAEQDGMIIGAVLCGNDGRRGYLHHLAVIPAFRREDVGRQLVAACLERLKADGIAKCHAFIFADNLDGAAFWSQIGWLARTELSVVSKSL